MSNSYEKNLVMYLDKIPDAEDYLNLRKAAGLSNKSREGAVTGLKNSLFTVTIYHNTDLIGMGRIIGDGGLFFQIVDIAVHPSYQGKGLGKKIMEEIMTFLKTSTPEGAYISLIADRPANKLYEKFGFKYTYPDSFGMYLRVPVT